MTAWGGSPGPWFTVTMTVRNNRPTIDACLDSILIQLGLEGEMVIVDAVSTDGTGEALAARAEVDARLRVIREACNRGVGRNRAAGLARTPVLLTNLDGDNEYVDRVVIGAADRFHQSPRPLGLLFVTGRDDADPSSGKFFVWDRSAFERIGGYPPRQGLEDPEAVLRAFRARLRVGRWMADRVANDLKPRRPGQAPSVSPWRRRRHVTRAARKFRIIGYRYSEFVRYLWLTRRTVPRFLAGTLVAAVGYLEGAFSRNSVGFLTEDEEDAHVVRALAAERRSSRAAT